MGRPNSPAALKLLSGRRPGTDSGGRPVEMGPAFLRTAPDPPDCLGQEAMAEWLRIVPELDRLKLLSRVTRSSLAAYCQTWEMFVEATKLVRAEGILVDGKKNQAVVVQLAASTELRRWAVEYGLTPASEQRIKPFQADAGESDFD